MNTKSLSSSLVSRKAAIPMPAAAGRRSQAGLKTGCVTMGCSGGGGALLLGRSAATTFGSDDSRAAQSTPSFSTNVTIEFAPRWLRQEGPKATSAEPCFTSRRSPATSDAPSLTSAKPVPRDRSTVPLADVRRAEAAGAHVLLACVSQGVEVLTASAYAAPGKAKAQMIQISFRIALSMVAVCEDVRALQAAGNQLATGGIAISCAVAERPHIRVCRY